MFVLFNKILSRGNISPWENQSLHKTT